jgi:hypothetical protein
MPWLLSFEPAYIQAGGCFASVFMDPHKEAPNPTNDPSSRRKGVGSKLRWPSHIAGSFVNMMLTQTLPNGKKIFHQTDLFFCILSYFLRIGYIVES